ncbi:hypothetical protein ZTR_09732 [Talaromyces verruculosus]|nr:hypothetical protein ZTR_09732 [Talaromyces verruculosus]
MASKGPYESVHQGGATEQRKKTPFFYNLSLQSLSLFWIAPVVAVLVLNFRGWVIGASLTYGIRSCDAGWWDMKEIQRHSNEDRNIQGALPAGGQSGGDLGAYSCSPSGPRLDLLFQSWSINSNYIPAVMFYYGIPYTINGSYAGLGVVTELEYNLMRNAQQTQILHKAPAFNTLSMCYNNGTSVNQVGNDMAVHCYNIPNPDDVTTYACLNATDCDWNALFAESADLLFRNQTVNTQVTEYSIPGYPTVYCFSSTFLRFPIYTLNPALGNPIAMDYSQLSNSNPSVNADPTIVNPDWTLLSWAVDMNGTVPFNRSAASILVSTYKDLIPIGSTSAPFLASLHNLAVAEGLYYVQYSTMKDSSSLNHDTNPILYIQTSVYVWLYGLESHTSKLAAAVAIFGCVVVLLKFVVGLVIRVDHRSFINMVVGALQQAPPRAVLDIPDLTEKDIGKQRVHIEHEKWAKFKFGNAD